VDDVATCASAVMRMKSMCIISLRASRRVGGAGTVGAGTVGASRALWCRGRFRALALRATCGARGRLARRRGARGKGESDATNTYETRILTNCLVFAIY
jgi:hypothetical protein